MPKIKNGLIRKRKEELRAETEQESLREKHHIADRNVMIVEKGSVVRSVAYIAGSVVRYCALILLVLLAVIGILAIIYPEPREALWKILLNAIDTIRNCFVQIQ